MTRATDLPNGLSAKQREVVENVVWALDVLAAVDPYSLEPSAVTGAGLRAKIDLIACRDIEHQLTRVLPCDDDETGGYLSIAQLIRALVDAWRDK